MPRFLTSLQDTQCSLLGLLVAVGVVCSTRCAISLQPVVPAHLHIQRAAALLCSSRGLLRSLRSLLQRGFVIHEHLQLGDELLQLLAISILLLLPYGISLVPSHC